MPYIDILCTFIMLSICAYTDWRERCIYNWVTLPMIPVGILNTIGLYGIDEGLSQLVWLIPAFIICYVAYRINHIGAGDAKLVIAMGALMGMEWSLALLCIGFVCGWVYAAVIFLKNRKGSLAKRQSIEIPLAAMLLIAFLIMSWLQFVI